MKHARVIFKNTKPGGQKGAWRYSIIAANGEPLFTSEGYTSKADNKRAFNTLLVTINQIMADLLMA